MDLNDILSAPFKDKIGRAKYIPEDNVDKIDEIYAEMLKETPTIIFGDAISYLSNTKKSFDCIFIDPPYSTDLGIKLLEIIDKNVEVLAKDGIVVFETDKLMRFVLNNLQLIKEKRYGKAYFYFLGRGNE